MRDYKPYLPHHRDSRLDDLDLAGRKANALQTAAAIVALVILMSVMLHALVRAVEHETVNRQTYSSVTAAPEYSRPAAFRKQKPTAEQMEHLEHLLQVSQVVR